MDTADENKIEKLLDLLEEARIISKRIVMTCEQIEKELREALNASWKVPPAA